MSKFGNVFKSLSLGKPKAGGKGLTGYRAKGTAAAKKAAKKAAQKKSMKGY